MPLISSVGNLGSLLIVVIFLCQCVSFGAVIWAEVSTLLEFFQNDIIGEEYDNCSLAVSLHNVLGLEALTDPACDKLEPSFLRIKYLDVHLIDILDLISVALASMHGLLSLIHYQDLLDEALDLILRLLQVRGYVIGGGCEGLGHEVVHALHDLKLLCTKGVEGACEAEDQREGEGALGVGKFGAINTDGFASVQSIKLDTFSSRIASISVEVEIICEQGLVAVRCLVSPGISNLVLNFSIH